MKCAFCPQPAVEHGGEHLWDDWINKALPPFKRKIRYSSMSGVKREYDRKKVDEKLPVVCAQCNNGWMSRITERVKNTFQHSMLEGASLSILPDGIALLAAFTFMKGVVASCAIPDKNEFFFTPRECGLFREHLTLPPSLYMWVSAYQGRKKYSGHFVPFIVTPDPPFHETQFFAFTYVVGHVVLQLLAGRWKYIHHRGRGPAPMFFKPNKYWNEAAIRFWPADGSVLSWPPPLYLGDNVLEEFIYRLKSPIALR